jgi:hypothetical protein
MKLVIALLIGASLAGGYFFVNSGVSLDQAFKSQDQTVRVGQKLVYSLSENQSIGDRYTRPIITPPGIVEFTEEVSHSEGLPFAKGAGQRETWIFRALKPGHVTITIPHDFRGSPRDGKTGELDVVS